MENHLQKFSQIDPDFVKKVKGKFYTNDLNTGLYSVDENKNFFQKLKVRFQEARFKFRTLFEPYFPDNSVLI